MKIGLIVACDLNGLIGVNNSLPWHNKTDLKRFSHLTKGHTVIMGRKTYESLPITKSGEKLPNRAKIVMSRKPHNDEENTTWITSEHLLQEAIKTPLAWIIGGAGIYHQMLMREKVDFIDLTIINDQYGLMEHNHAYLPHIPFSYKVVAEYQNPEDPLLWHRRYEKRHS